MADGPVATTTAGDVRGHRDGEVWAFLGIPYAAAPVGERRFAAPEPPAPWTGVRDADAFGPAPPQPDRPIGVWFHGPTPSTDEDCLSLNVWTPAVGDGEARPVLVWIHGGGWALGFSGSPLFHGARLAAAIDAVVVTINYRLGSLGWLNHPALAATPGGPAANWGLQDMAAALAWVRDNAAAFGGDPSRSPSAASRPARAACFSCSTHRSPRACSRARSRSRRRSASSSSPTQRGHAWTRRAERARLARTEPIDLDALRAAPGRHDRRRPRGAARDARVPRHARRRDAGRRPGDDAGRPAPRTGRPPRDPGADRHDGRRGDVPVPRGRAQPRARRRHAARDGRPPAGCRQATMRPTR